MGAPRAAARAGGDQIRVDASEFKDFADRLKTVDKKLATKARKRVRAVADDTVQAMKDKVLEPPPPAIGGITYGKKTYTSKKGAKHTRKVITGFLNSTRTRGPRSRGTRSAIAGTLGTRLSNSKKAAGVIIRADAKKMPAGREPMVKAYNVAKAFRHPVFADAIHKTSSEWKWVYQRGNPYFGSIFADHRPEFMRRLRDVMDEVLAELDQ